MSSWVAHLPELNRLISPTASAPSSIRSVVTVAPKWRSISSVWSRVGSASITVVVPAVFRPQRMIADFTWAEATGRR